MVRAVWIAAALIGCAATPGQEPERPSSSLLAQRWKPLFNGKDFDGWEVYVGSPGKGQPPRGLNNDPDKVFSVTEADGAPAVRVSGQTIGGISTKEEFENFHFRVEFKWGKQTWPPRKDIPRDSGILYWGTGPHGAGSGGWLKSVESNVMEMDCGSFWSVVGTIVDIEIADERIPYEEDPKGGKYPFYKKGGQLQTFGPNGGNGCRPDPRNVEKPHGEWNVAEVIGFNGTGIHIFNGQVTLVLSNSRHKVGDQIVPYRKGRIQLQSEGAEVYYRNMRVRSIEAIPEDYRDYVPKVRKEKGFVPLFDAENLPHWVQCGPGSFKVENGVATGVGGMGLWWYRKQKFADFILRGEFLQEPGGESDSGIFVRFPDPGNDPMVGVKKGHEIEIGDAKPSKGSTGSIYPFQGPTELPLKPPGEWNEYEIKVTGTRYQVTLNGKRINDYTDTQGRPLSGYVGLQNYPGNKAPYTRSVSHRNVQIKELP